MNPQETLSAALGRCAPVACRSLEEFLDPLLDEGPETLAQLPGTPGQVLAAQFTHYAKSSVLLTESLRREQAAARGLAERLLRLPAARRDERPAPVRRAKAHDPRPSRAPAGVA